MNHARTRGVVGGLALALLSTTAPGQTAAVKPTASEERSISFFIPAQPLQSALDAFVRETGWQIGYAADLPQGAVSKPVSGVMTPGEALSRIVEGAGVDLRRIDPKAVTLVRLDRTSQVEDGAATALDPIAVEGAGENARGPVNGIVARRTASATKTDTPILEAPQSISVVGRTQMERQAATSVTEVLRYVPGVVVETYGPDPKGYDWVYMRGFNAQSSSDFRDGLRQSSLSYSFFRTEPYALERVEVLRGPSSALYGQSDAGGLINKVSKRPTEDAHYQIEGQVGSYERFQGAFDIGGPVDADGKLLYRVIGVARKSNTQFDYPTGDERKDDRLYLAPSFTWKPNDQTKLTVYGEALRDRSGGSALYSRAPGSRWLTVGDPSFDGFKQDQQQIGYEFEHVFNDVWTVRQNARFGHTETNLDVTQGYWAPAFGEIARRNRSFDEDMDAFASDTQVEAKLGKTNAQGVELEAKISLAQGLDFVGSYTYADVKVKKGVLYPAGTDGNGAPIYENSKGKRPMLVPAHTASGWLNYTFQGGAFQGLGLGGGVRFVGASYGDVLNKVKIDDWTVFDAGLSYKWRNATFALNAVNLFDKKYFTTCEGETSCYQGQRRTVIGRVRLDF